MCIRPSSIILIVDRHKEITEAMLNSWPYQLKTRLSVKYDVRSAKQRNIDKNYMEIVVEVGNLWRNKKES